MLVQCEKVNGSDKSPPALGFTMILILGSVVGPPRSPALFLAGAVNTETSLDDEEETRGDLDNYEQASICAPGKLGRLACAPSP